MDKKYEAHIHNEYHSAMKNNEIMASVATWVDLEIIILSEISQIEKDKYHLISLIWESNKMMQNNFLYNRLKDIKVKLRVSKGEIFRQRNKLRGWD